MRIKLTENQFNTLIVEQSQCEGIFCDIENGNVIIITTNGDDLKFRVTNQDGNSLMMINTNEGSTTAAFTYLLAKSEQLDDKNVSLTRWNTKKGRSTKKPHAFNNVSKVEVQDANGKQKDIYTVGAEKSNDDNDSTGFNLVDVLGSLNAMKVDERFFFRTGGTDLLFRVISIEQNVEAKLKLVAVSGSDKVIYDPLKGQVFTLKLDVSSMSPSETVDGALDFVMYNESGQAVKLSDVKEWGDYYKTFGDEEDKDDEDDGLSKDEVLNAIMSDPVLRDTFYKQPKLMGFINSGDPVGIATANKLLDKFNSSEEGEKGQKSKFGEFKKGETVEFNFLHDVDFTFTNRKNNQRLVTGKEYDGKIEINSDSGNVRIVSDKTRGLRWQILLKDKVSDSVYNATIRGKVRDKVHGNDVSNKKTQIRVNRDR